MIYYFLRRRRMRQLHHLCNVVGMLDQLVDGHEAIMFSATAQELLEMNNSGIMSCPSRGRLACYRDAIDEVERRMTERQEQRLSRLRMAFDAVARSFCDPQSEWIYAPLRDHVIFQKNCACFEFSWTREGLLFCISTMSEMAKQSSQEGLLAKIGLPADFLSSN